MGFELPKAFKLETKSFLWLIALISALILLFQSVELPKGIALWPKLSQGGTSMAWISSVFSDNESNSSSTFESQSTLMSNPSKLSLPPENVPLNNNASSTNAVDASNSSSSFEVLSTSFVSNPPKFSLPPENVPFNNISSSTNAVDASNSASTFEVQSTPFVSNPAKLSLPPMNVPSENYSQSSLLVHVPPKNPQDKRNGPLKEVLSLSDMNELLIQSCKSPNPMIQGLSTQVDQDFIVAKRETEKAPPMDNDGLYTPLYRNASRFRRSYELMEQMLKVYIYKEGDKPVFHKPDLGGIYASEGWFMKLLEANKHFVTKNPAKAHLFYLPFSSQILEETLYVPSSHNPRNLEEYLKNYVDMISRKYPFWNRTNGADHFLVACHDWAPTETNQYMANCLRAMCNADAIEGFKFGKDVSLPETTVRDATKPIKYIGGNPPSKRNTLAFFAGGMHGYLRPRLVQHWGNNKDPDMQIFSRIPNDTFDRKYIAYMRSSKYCICGKGHEVNSPRVVEAIMLECVPVIISDNFVPPLFEALNWESFTVFVQEKDVPDLKNILLSIPEDTYLKMYMGVKEVQKHFLWHFKPVKYDLFHMILHSIWYNRVFQYIS